MIRTDQLNQVQNATVYDSAGDKVGKAGTVYLDDTSGDPTWVTVKTGLFGNNESFAPLEGAAFTDDRLAVAYTKEQIKGAPNLPTDGHLEPAQERDLYRYYARPADATTNSSTGGSDSSEGNDSGDAEGSRGQDDIRDCRGEPLDVDGDLDPDASLESQSPRLRKYVVTEQHTVTVPVERGQVTVEPVPAGDDSGDDEGRQA